jgi:drug/metabolite transporter (DMT)-like permease
LLDPNTLGGLIALLAAATWGTGDFMGGLATRKNSPYQVVALVSLSGLVILWGAMLFRGESWPSPVDTLWAIAASLSGTIGIAALYRGLATAQAALVAPTASVVGVALPVLVSTISSGPPTLEKWGGMILGAVGIWFVSGGSINGGGENKKALLLALLAGFGFGGFFTLIAQVESGSLFAPLVVAKFTSLVFALVILKLQHTRLPQLRGNRLALTAGFFDASGNVLYLLAAHLTRMEFAVVLSSMSPAITVLLASLVTKQRVLTIQKVGVAVCLVAIMLIVL